jgi:four helix bundle protein
MKEILPHLPPSEKFDLKDQLSRSCKAIPRLIAEGYGKRHQQRGFQKYLDDAMAENNETVVSLMQSRDLYGHLFDLDLCNQLITGYTVTGKRIYRLRESWSQLPGKY